jgi:hypothetical protein
MLRDRPFTPIERCLAWAFSGLTFGAGLFGILLAIRTRNWRVGLAGVGVAAVGVLYARSAWRGRPLALCAPPPDGVQDVATSERPR